MTGVGKYGLCEACRFFSLSTVDVPTLFEV